MIKLSRITIVTLVIFLTVAAVPGSEIVETAKLREREGHLPPSTPLSHIAGSYFCAPFPYALSLLSKSLEKARFRADRGLLYPCLRGSWFGGLRAEGDRACSYPRGSPR